MDNYFEIQCRAERLTVKAATDLHRYTESEGTYMYASCYVHKCYTMKHMKHCAFFNSIRLPPPILNLQELTIDGNCCSKDSLLTRKEKKCLVFQSWMHIMIQVYFEERMHSSCFLSLVSLLLTHIYKMQKVAYSRTNIQIALTNIL